MKRIRDTRDYTIRGLLFQPEDVNRLLLHRRETLNHWITKALLFHLLRNLGHDIVTEFTITGMGIGDILDLTTNVQYEVETKSKPSECKKRAKQYKRTGVEVIVIPIKKLPTDMKQRYKALKEYVWE